MEKIHKVELYIVDLNDYGLENLLIEIERNTDLLVTTINKETKNIEWKDNNPFNYINTDIKTLNKYYNDIKE